MVEEFKKWLKKQRDRDYNYYSFFKDSKFVFDNPKTEPEDVVSVRELGKWHLGIMQEHYNWCKEKGFNFWEIFKGAVSLQVAVACLGEKEVRRRLAEAGGK